MNKPDIHVVAEAFRTRSRKFQKACKILRNVGVALSIAALFASFAVPEQSLPKQLIEWSLIILSLLCHVSAEYFFNIARKFHFNSRDGYRWFLLWSSIKDAQTQANLPLDDLQQKAIDFKLAATVSEQNGSYFLSRQEKGWKCLIENLYESLYYTRSLMEIQHTGKTRWLYWTVALMAIALIAMLVAHTPGDVIDPYLTSLALFTLGVPIVIELIHLSRTRFSIDELGKIQERMKPFVAKTKEELGDDLSILIDMISKYYSVTVEQEMLSNRIYHKYNKRLGNNYATHIAQLTSTKQ